MKTWMINNGSLLFLFLIFFQTELKGQELPEEKQEIIKTFEAQLEEAAMIPVSPVIKPLTPVKKKYKYNVTILPLEIVYPEPAIKPVAADTDLPFENHSFLARFGYGNVKNPSASISYYKTDAYQLDRYIGIDYDEFDNSQKIAHQKARSGSGVAGIKYRFKEKWQLNAGIETRYRDQPLYFVYEPKDIQRNLFNAGGRMELAYGSANEDEVDFSIATRYSVINISNPEVNEGFFDVTARLGKRKGSWGLEFPLTFQGTLQTSLSDLYALQFKPELKYANATVHIRAGAALYYDATEKLVPWPQVSIDVALAGKGLHIFASSRLRTSVNNIHQLSQENPWMNPVLPALNNFLGKEVYGGIRGEGFVLGYEMAAGFVDGSNWVQFHNMENLSMPTAFYSDFNAVFIRGNLDFALSKNLVIKGLLTKNFFDNTGTNPLYGIHSLECKAQAEFRFWKNKVRLIPELFVTDRQWTRVLDDLTGSPRDIRLNNRVELNATLDIWFTKKAGLYARIGNILNNNYEQWYGYPVLGIHGQAGFMLKL